MNTSTTTSPRGPAAPGHGPAEGASPRLPRLSLAACLAGVALMVTAAAGAWLATPRLQALHGAPSLDATVPKAFGDWRALQDSVAQVDVSQGVETVQEQPYDQTVMRTYVNSRGDQIMLALAWGERQRQDVKVHRPEVCYPAQGYFVRRIGDGGPVSTAGRAEPVPTTQLLTEARGGGYEAVRYWIRIGTQYGGDGMAARWYILNEGFQGRIPDGMLVRASQRLTSAEGAAQSQALMAGFLSELVAAVPAGTRTMLVR
ncbi:exosortase C-terminal domain/associated protein EpsI [Roseateles sp. 22389]|uniref:exosortase C-terminal domain/associated protein EpsI n=1 Tax=Roseateles sp. 22389 TaxID=3453916 RepID=UPI002627CBF1|nr:exosortase C-terminal domain/associated protein EpsI [uncultured Roseateles sp.]